MSAPVPADELEHLAVVARRRSALLEMLADELAEAPNDPEATALRRALWQFQAAHGVRPVGAGPRPIRAEAWAPRIVELMAAVTDAEAAVDAELAAARAALKHGEVGRLARMVGLGDRQMQRRLARRRGDTNVASGFSCETKPDRNDGHAWPTSEPGTH